MACAGIMRRTRLCGTWDAAEPPRAWGTGDGDQGFDVQPRWLERGLSIEPPTSLRIAN